MCRNILQYWDLAKWFHRHEIRSGKTSSFSWSPLGCLSGTKIVLMWKFWIMLLYEDYNRPVEKKIVEYNRG